MGGVGETQMEGELKCTEGGNLNEGGNQRGFFFCFRVGNSKNVQKFIFWVGRGSVEGWARRESSKKAYGCSL